MRKLDLSPGTRDDWGALASSLTPLMHAAPPPETIGGVNFVTIPIVTSFALLFGARPTTAFAQEPNRASVEVAAGWVGFPDDGTVSEGLLGAAVRWYPRPRMSVGPEIDYIQGHDHSHLIITGNVTYDLLAATNGRPRRIVPFLVVGGGLFQTRETFLTGRFTSSEGAFTAGGGVRTSASDRVTLGLDTRIGWELHVRVNGFVGVRLGR